MFVGHAHSGTRFGSYASGIRHACYKRTLAFKKRFDGFALLYASYSKESLSHLDISDMKGLNFPRFPVLHGPQELLKQIWLILQVARSGRNARGQLIGVTNSPSPRRHGEAEGALAATNFEFRLARDE